MTLATILGILLLAGPQFQGVRSPVFALQAEPKPQSSNSQASSTQDQTNPTPPVNSELPASQPPASASPSGNPSSAQPPATKPAPPGKAPAKVPGAKTPPKKRHHVIPHPKEPSKVVVRNGGTSETQVQISSGTGGQQAAQQRKNTDSMLGAATENLKKVSGRQLNPSQQDMVKQIRTYMQQSKAAADAGDLQGANNLAVKAHLLSEELVKH
jgi:hypothetical protein